MDHHGSYSHNKHVVMYFLVKYGQTKLAGHPSLSTPSQVKLPRRGSLVAPTSQVSSSATQQHIAESGAAKESEWRTLRVL